MSKKQPSITDDMLKNNPFSFGETAEERLAKAPKFKGGHFTISNNPVIKESVIRLAPQSLRLLMYIAMQMKPGKDYVKIDPEKFMEVCEIKSANTWRSARAELIDSCFIAHTTYSNYYWVNISTMSSQL